MYIFSVECSGNERFEMKYSMENVEWNFLARSFVFEIINFLFSPGTRAIERELSDHCSMFLLASIFGNILSDTKYSLGRFICRNIFSYSLFSTPPMDKIIILIVNMYLIQYCTIQYCMFSRRSIMFRSKDNQRENVSKCFKINYFTRVIMVRVIREY